MNLTNNKPIIYALILTALFALVGYYYIYMLDPEHRADMNGDGVLDEKDAIYLSGHLIDNRPLFGDPDVNCDKDVNASDVFYLTMYLAGSEGYPLYPGC